MSAKKRSDVCGLPLLAWKSKNKTFACKVIYNFKVTLTTFIQSDVIDSCEKEVR